MELPEIAKSYRRQPLRKGFKAYVPVESPSARWARQLREQFEREYKEMFEEEYNKRQEEWINGR